MYVIIIMGGWPSGQWQQTVNLSTKVFVGSNPSPPTIFSDNMRNFFQILSIPPSYIINFDDLEANFLKLQKTYHPDNANQNVENIMLSSLINQGYKTLQNNLMRAMYLIKIWYNVDILNNEQTIVDNDLMEKVLTLQMELVEMQNNSTLIANFKTKIQTEIEFIEKQLENLLEKQNISIKDISVKKVIALKFYYSILDKVLAKLN